MATPLGDYIVAQRTALGLNQTELAERAGMGRAHLSELERGKIALPNAGLRRDIARALGVSHLDILIAAGELQPDEVSYAQASGVIEERPDDPRRRLHELIDQINWQPNMVWGVEGMLENLAGGPPPHERGTIKRVGRVTNGGSN